VTVATSIATDITASIAAIFTTRASIAASITTGVTAIFTTRACIATRTSIATIFTT